MFTIMPVAEGVVEVKNWAKTADATAIRLAVLARLDFQAFVHYLMVCAGRRMDKEYPADGEQVSYYDQCPADA